MNQNDYDRAERVAIKRLDPPGFLAWLLAGLDPDLKFRRWLETQGAPFPGEPERRCDCVAEFASAGGTQPPWAMLVEPQGQWQGHFLTRACQYLFILHDELRHGPYDADRYLMGIAVVDLCERPLQQTLSWQPPGATGVGLTVAVWMRHVYQESAGETLDGIESGKVALCVLVWVPLMIGGEEEEVARRWQDLANTEPDRVRRSQFAALALVLSEKRGREAIWHKALEDFNVIESPYLREIRDEGRDEGRKEAARGTLITVLRAKFTPALPPDLLDEVERQGNLEVISRWLELAIGSTTLEAFRAAVGATTTNGAAH